MGRSCSPKSSGVDRAGGLRGGFPRRDPYDITEICVRQFFILRPLIRLINLSGKHGML